MTFRTLILRSLRHHWRIHLGVLLGAAIGSAILIGALVVGDSVRGSLRQGGLERLGPFHLALSSGDRFYRPELFNALEANHTLAGLLTSHPQVDPSQVRLTQMPVSLVHLPGTLARQDGAARANRIHVYGMSSSAIFRQPPAPEDARLEIVRSALWDQKANPPLGRVLLNETLAAQLKAREGDDLILRLHKPSALSRDAVISPREDQSVALRLKVHAVMSGAEGGNLSLRSSQIPPLNAFVRQEDLDTLLHLQGRVNLTLIPPLAHREPVSPLARFWRDIGRRIDQMRGLTSAHQPALETLVPDDVQASMLQASLGRLWDLSDAQLQLRSTPTTPPQLELISSRIFLEDAAVLAATRPQAQTNQSPGVAPGDSRPVTNAVGILTYLVNELKSGDRSAPYSMVTAAGAPWVPADLQTNEVVVNEWLAEDLGLRPGSELEMSYYLLDTGAQLTERTQRFRVRSVVPLQGLHADRTLMPEFPGLSKAESTRDWDAGFKLVHTVRDKDEAYWKQYRGTPKAFISLAAGQALWGNRFGRLTALRYPFPSTAATNAFQDLVQSTVLSNLDPSEVGLRFETVRQQALQAADQGQDFGQLFIGFSFFLIFSALVLMSMLFRFGAEERQVEIGVLLSLGFRPARVRRILLGEALALSSVGALIGLAGSMLYSKAMLWALGTLWKDAVGTSSLAFHLDPLTLLIGVPGSILVCVGSIAWALRREAQRPARELLSGQAVEQGGRTVSTRSRISLWVAVGALTGAAALLAAALKGNEAGRAPLFFGAGALLLTGGLGALSLCLNKAAQNSGRRLTRLSLMLRGLGRRRSRSLAAIALLASGSFLVFAIGANRLNAPRNPELRSAGTGGFQLLAESSLPIVRDPNSREGQEALGLDPTLLKATSIVPFRVKAGDDASCLNLNRAQQPRLLGVNPELLASRGSFSFAAAASGLAIEQGWRLLTPSNGSSDDAVPAIGDAASMQWALHLKLGETLPFTDEQGRRFNIRLVASLNNSILQGSLVVDERELARRFPTESGAQYFLIDTPAAGKDQVSAHLSKGLQDYGFESVSTVDRLNQFNGVQNTYLNTFQLLGGLGVILGSVGLGLVLLRNALERRGEIAVQLALGYSPSLIKRLLLTEHLILLAGGLALGVGAATLAVAPQLLGAAQEVPLPLLGLILVGSAGCGLLSTVFASNAALRGRLLDALRPE